MKALWHQIKFGTAKAVKRRTKIPPRSKAQAARLREYKRLADEWRSDPANQTCRFQGCRCRKVDIHHTRGRVGSLLTATEYWVPVCRTHHNWIGENPVQARQLGLLGQWGRDDR